MKDHKLSHSFIFKELLAYEAYPLDSINDGAIVKWFIEEEERFTVYCPHCKADRVFLFRGAGRRPFSPYLTGQEDVDKETRDYIANNIGDHRFAYQCQMDTSHWAYSVILLSRDSILKIGQYPSPLDLYRGKAKEKSYRKLLDYEQNKELDTAHLLASSGYSIGAFVYYRRIIEWLIEDATIEASKTLSSIDSESLKKMRVHEKIKELKGFLPDHLVNNTSIYSILSSGIHVLPNDVCAEYDKALSSAIDLILHEKFAKRETAKMIADNTIDLGNIKSKM